MINKAKMLDKRVLQRNLVKGSLSQNEVNDYLNSLPDLEGEFEEIVMDGDEKDDDLED
ncbi:MAG: hypothetical protein JXR91_05275 [Deltaproteobacteria bacterium]|nr:hypothetical protein [Deltaproteobacteria bacterium]